MDLSVLARGFVLGLSMAAASGVLIVGFGLESIVTSVLMT
jgi:hypothetical protein